MTIHWCAFESRCGVYALLFLYISGRVNELNTAGSLLTVRIFAAMLWITIGLPNFLIVKNSLMT